VQVVLEELVEDHLTQISTPSLVLIQMEQREQIQVSILPAEVRLRQGVEREQKEIRFLKDREVQFQQVVMAVLEELREAAEAVREELEPMVVFLLEQAEQGFPLRFLAIMEEMPKPMVQVEMAEQIYRVETLVTRLEQAVR
jgi:hypothetical protein